MKVTDTDPAYDANGNTTSQAGILNSYDFENHLTQHGAVTIVYDGDGNRVSETVGGVTTNYLVDTQNPTGYAQVMEELQSGAVIRRYTWGQWLIAKDEIGSTTQTSYYGYDGHGSVRFLTDTSGAVTDTYDYDAFGNLIRSTGSTTNNYLFAGEQFDSALGLYYNRARYLDVKVGRFWGMDTHEGNEQIPPSLHRYLFGSGDPVDRLDPSGNDDLGSLTVAVGVTLTLAAITTAGLIAYHYLHHEDMGIYFTNDFFWQNELRGRQPRDSLSSDEITIVKQNALEALRRAFAPYPKIRVHEGKGSDHTVEIDTNYPTNFCGGTRFSPSSYSYVNYSCILNRAEFALNNANRSEILPAVGWGLGNTAAHEIGHQLSLTEVNKDEKLAGGPGRKGWWPGYPQTRPGSCRVFAL